MPVICTPDALAESAKCFCAPENIQRAESIYLMMQIAGLDLTPSELAERSKCFACMDEQSSMGALIYLTCVAAQAAGA